MSDGEFSDSGNFTVFVVPTLGYVINNTNLSFTFSLPLNSSGEWHTGYFDSGNYTIIITVSDGILNNSRNVTVTVLNVNRAPVLASIGNLQVNETQTLSFKVNATDPDNDTLTYGTNATFGTFNTSTGLFNWTPNLMQRGNYSVTLTVTDGNLTDSENISIIVGFINGAPVIAPVGNKQVNVNQTLSFTINATDPDNNTLNYSAANLSLLPGATFINNVFSWTPNATQKGTYTVTFKVTDGYVNTSETILITVFDSCDLNRDGIVIKDYNDLMKSYKCFLGVEKNCGINYQNWNSMKKEYNPNSACFR